MYKRGLRPFQNVYYVSRQIKDLLEWRGGSLNDLHDFSKVVKLLGDEEILSYLLLNDKSIDTPYISLPHQVGIESILNEWQSNESINTEISGHLKRIIDNFDILNKNSALEKCLVSGTFDISHDSDYIYVVLENTENNNLLNKADLTKNIVRQVIKTYSVYFTYSDVANSIWFATYIDQL